MSDHAPIHAAAAPAAPHCTLEGDIYGAYNVVIGEAIIGLWIMSVWSWRIKLDIPSFRSGKAKNLVQEYALYAKQQGFSDAVNYAVVMGWLNAFYASGLVWDIIDPKFELQEVCGGIMLVLLAYSIYCRRAVGDGWEKCYDAIVLWLCALCCTVAPAVSRSKGCYEYSINGVDHGFRLSMAYTVISAILYWGFKSLSDGDFYDWENLLEEEDEAPAEPTLSEFFFGVQKKTEQTEALLEA
jgi:hypothetical protein